MNVPKRTARPRRFDPDADTAPWDADEAPAAEAPRPRASQSDSTHADDNGDMISIPVARGRQAIKAERSSGDTTSQFYRWGDNGDVQVVKFLEIDPLAYLQHWVTRSGKQSFPCIGKNCPLCEVGSKTSQKIVYSLVNLSAEGGPAAQTMEVTPSIDDTLAAYDADTRNGPLSKRWYALSRTVKARAGGFGKYDYHIIPIKDRDLEEDYDIVLADAEDAVKGIDPIDPMTVIGKISRSTLQEVADELMS